MKKTKDYSGESLRKRLMEVSGIEQPNHHQQKKDTELVDVFSLTYGELKELIRVEVREYFDETFESPTATGSSSDDEELDEELQRFLDELNFELK